MVTALEGEISSLQPLDPNHSSVTTTSEGGDHTSVTLEVRRQLIWGEGEGATQKETVNFGNFWVPPPTQDYWHIL